MSTKTVLKTESQWKQELSPEQYRVLREKGTEWAFSGAYWNHKEDGTYVCGACGAPLFDSNHKFDSRCGWPSFYDALDKDKVEFVKDATHGMVRTEVICTSCGSHLGHIFGDAPQTPTGQRYCINSVSLKFQPRSGEEQQPDSC